jgi:hypothetical protein
VEQLRLDHEGNLCRFIRLLELWLHHVAAATNLAKSFGWCFSKSSCGGRLADYLPQCTPKSGDVLRGKRMKGEALLNGSSRRMLFEQVFLATAQAFKKLLAVNWFHPAALQVVVPAVKHFPGLGELVKISSNDIFNQLARGAAGRQLVELGLHVGRKLHFHGSAPFLQNNATDTGKCRVKQFDGYSSRLPEPGG